jgi:hypothetical protein
VRRLLGGSGKSGRFTCRRSTIPVNHPGSRCKQQGFIHVCDSGFFEELIWPRALAYQSFVICEIFGLGGLPKACSVISLNRKVIRKEVEHVWGCWRFPCRSISVNQATTCPQGQGHATQATRSSGIGWIAEALKACPVSFPTASALMACRSDSTAYSTVPSTVL